MSSSRTVKIIEGDAKTIQNEERRLREELARVEKQIYHLETSYLENTAQIGNLVRGWGEVSTSRSNQKRKIRPEDRIFTQSSATGMAANEEASPRKKKSRK